MESDYIYYNALICDNRTEDNGFINNPNAIFYESRDTPIINDVSHYNLSIVRFSMNGTNKYLPLWIPLIETGQTNINKTIYKITIKIVKTGLGAGTYEITENLIYFSNNLDASLPSQPLINQDINNNYYYVYNIHHFVEMFNNCINVIYNNIDNQITTNGGTLTTKKPVLKYNDNNNKFEMYFDNYGFGDTDKIGNDETAEIFFNTNLFLLLDFYSTYIGHIGDKNYKIIIRNNRDNIIKLKNQLNFNDLNEIYYKIEQDFKNVSLWSPVSSIVFTSNLIPIEKELISSPFIFGNSNTNIISNSSDFSNIITDIELPITDYQDYRNGFVQYIPSNYRMISLKNSQQALRDIDLRIQWKNRLNGQLNDIKLPNGSSINIKMMFIKKYLR